MNNLVIGQFVPGDGFLYKIDPRTKIMVTIGYVFVLVFAQNWVTYAWSAAFLGLALLLTKQGLGLYWRGLKPILWLIMFTVILQLAFSGGTPVLFQLGFIKVTQPGLINGIYVVVRFVLIVLMSTILTITTPPTSIASAIESLLKPLKAVKVPVAELALMLSIALRFVPLLMGETDKIMKAQKSRGMSMSTGSLMKRAKAVVPLLVPLFVGALQRAFDLANAMEVRGFETAEGRTRYRELAYTRNDTLVLVSSLAFLVVFIILLFVS